MTGVTSIYYQQCKTAILSSELESPAVNRLWKMQYLSDPLNIIFFIGNEGDATSVNGYQPKANA